jgi:hypothetical protein
MLVSTRISPLPSPSGQKKTYTKLGIEAGLSLFSSGVRSCPRNSKMKGETGGRKKRKSITSFNSKVLGLFRGRDGNVTIELIDLVYAFFCPKGANPLGR